jgi:hypothetical protein
MQFAPSSFPSLPYAPIRVSALKLFPPPSEKDYVSRSHIRTKQSVIPMLYAVSSVRSLDIDLRLTGEQLRIKISIYK